MKKTIQATIRIKAEDHHVELRIDVTAKQSLVEKFQLIAETIACNNYLSDGSNRLESIYFFEMEDIRCTE
jgi:hypothetical protein